MKKYILMGGVLLAVFAVSASFALAAGAGKAPIYDANSNFTCSTGAQPAIGDPTFGFVIMNINHRGDLIIEVSLKGAAPNTVYDIWVNQYPGACPLGAPTSPGALKTNRNGNGNAHLKVPSEAGAKNFWISALGGGQVLRSTALNLLEWKFTANDSLYYNGPNSTYPLYGTGPISFSWDPVTGNVTSGYYNEVAPPYTGTTYYNVVTSGSVVGGVVNLTFDRTVPNTHHFTFFGSLSGDTLTGNLDGPYFFTATGN